MQSFVLTTKKLKMQLKTAVKMSAKLLDMKKRIGERKNVGGKVNRKAKYTK